LSFQVLAFNNLAEGPLTEHVKYEIPVSYIASQLNGQSWRVTIPNILVSVVFIPENIVNIKDIVAILIIIAIILDTFTWLGEYSSGISGRFIFECGITDPVCGWQMSGQSLQRLQGSQCQRAFGFA
jgi:hypothetical protein